MEHTAQFSAIPANARGRRAVVFAMLFAWLAWLVTCPNVIDGVGNLAHAGEKPVAHTVADSTHDGSHPDVCCTVAPHATAVAPVLKFNLSIHFILTAVLPVMVTSLTSLVVAASNTDFMRSSWSGWTRNSLLFCTLWPQAPPH